MGKKLTAMAVTLLGLSTVVFGSVFVTGDPIVTAYGDVEGMTQDRLDELRRQYGYDRPIVVQYVTFIKGIVTELDFGRSITRQRSVRDLIFEFFPNTLRLALSSIVFILVVGIPLGVLAAANRNSLLDKGTRFLTVFGMAAPTFWVAIMLVLLFGAYLKVLPVYGMSGIQSMILPTLALSTVGVAGVMRMTRSSMLDQLGSEYTKFARVKGMAERMVVWKHALRNALLPVTTYTGLMLAGLLNGAVVIEVIFAWPGIGRLMLEGVVMRDLPVVQGTILVAGFFYILLSGLVDIIYGYLDPRIRIT